ncbi:MAG: LPS assembly lipoprotein LptE [Pseudomonadota bacterium]
MLSFDRRVFLLSSLALTAGCGFTPAFAPGGAATKLQNSVMLDDPGDRADYVLVRRFEERLGAAAPARYGLSYSVLMYERGIAISSNNIITRYNVLGTVTYALRDMSTEKVLTSGKVEHFTSYSAEDTTISAQAAKQDAEERLMLIMTDQMITRLTAEAGQLPA